MGITETIPITASAFFVLLLRAVFPVIIYLYAPIPSGVFCIPVIMASVTIGPAAAIDAPIANDLGWYLIPFQVISQRIRPSFLQLSLQL